MNNEDRPTDRPTFLDVNDHNFGCIQDRFVILGSKVWFCGRPIQRGHLNLPSTDPCCHGNEIWDKIGYNSAYMRDISKIQDQGEIMRKEYIDWSQSKIFLV